MLFIRPCCHDEDRQAARMKALKHGISDGSQWPVRYSNSAPITLIARTNVAYGSDATLKKCDINCVIIPQLIISSKRQRDQGSPNPVRNGFRAGEQPIWKSFTTQKQGCQPTSHTYFLTLIRHEAIDPTLGVSLIPILNTKFFYLSRWLHMQASSIENVDFPRFVFKDSTNTTSRRMQAWSA